jgi:hypothetical protein
MVYVTEDYTQTTRHSAHWWEYAAPGGASSSGPWANFSTLQKTYTELGGYVFGVYNGGFGYRTFVFNGTAPQYIHVQAMTLDNSGPTTRLRIDFRKDDVIGSDYVLNDTESAIIVYW